ncbi:hypothetical protein Tco_1510177, partial [Tanacetum coccineum]
LAQKAKKDGVKELCVKNKVNFLALQEIKIENMEIFSVKMCWGNYAFDYVHSDSVGNSGGARIFNSFMQIAVWRREVPLGGISFMWCHKSATKMSKLDREWNKRNMDNMKNVATKHKEDLEALEARIDKGEGTDEIVNKRMEVVKIFNLLISYSRWKWLKK